jgi:putative transposase
MRTLNRKKVRWMAKEREKTAVSVFGRPKQLMSGHGTTFTSLPGEGCPEPEPNGFQQWLKLADIDHAESRVRHPQSNGKVEKVGGILRKLVQHFGSLERAL